MKEKLEDTFQLITKLLNHIIGKLESNNKKNLSKYSLILTDMPYSEYEDAIEQTSRLWVGFNI